MSETKRGRGRPPIPLDMGVIRECMKLGYPDKAIAKECGLSLSSWMRKKATMPEIAELERQVAAESPLMIFSALWQAAAEGKVGPARELLRRYDERWGGCPSCGYRE
jgi:hypothetical protein